MKRLLEVAREFNIGKEALVQFLAIKGFRGISSNSNSKLTEPMYNAIAMRVEFLQHKIDKQQSKEIVLTKGPLMDDLRISKEEFDIDLQEKKKRQPGLNLEIQKKKIQKKERVRGSAKRISSNKKSVRKKKKDKSIEKNQVQKINEDNKNIWLGNKKKKEKTKKKVQEQNNFPLPNQWLANLNTNSEKKTSKKIEKQAVKPYQNIYHKLDGVKKYR